MISHALAAFDHQRVVRAGLRVLLVTCLCLAYQDVDAQAKSVGGLLEDFASSVVSGKRRCELGVQWMSDGELYQGVLVIQGGTGRFDLVAPRRIVQTLTSKTEWNSVFLFGSNPRDIRSRPAEDYVPDSFVLTREGGVWKMATCDRPDHCSGVTVVEGRCA